MKNWGTITRKCPVPILPAILDSVSRKHKGARLTCWHRIKNTWQRKISSLLKKIVDFKIVWIDFKVNCWVKKIDLNNISTNSSTWRQTQSLDMNKRSHVSLMNLKTNIDMNSKWQKTILSTFMKSKSGSSGSPLIKRKSNSTQSPEI